MTGKHYTFLFRNLIQLETNASMFGQDLEDRSGAAEEVGTYRCPISCHGSECYELEGQDKSKRIAFRTHPGAYQFIVETRLAGRIQADPGGFARI